MFVVGFAFLQPYLPGQADPNLCQVDSTTGIQFRNKALFPRGDIAELDTGGRAVSYTHLDVYKRQTLFTMTEILADELGKEGGPKGCLLYTSIFFKVKKS